MTTNEELLAEVRKLRVQVSAHQKALNAAGSRRHAWMRHVLHDFEYNPATQYKVHLYAMYVWTGSFITVICLFSLARGFWDVVSVLYLVLISLYANWATDYGAMSAALAAQHEAPLPEVPLEAPSPFPPEAERRP